MNPSTYGSTKNKSDDVKSPTILHNLPSLADFVFIGRQVEQKKLLESISPNYRQHIAVVNGLGGIGKTSLVLKVADLCQNPDHKPKYLADLEIPEFKAIIFVSLKKSYFDFNSDSRQVDQDSSLQYIFKEIASTLQSKKNNINKINQTSGEKQIKVVYQCLNQQDTLLIIDNLDAAKDKDSILLFLSNLPTTVQAIITTRDEGFSYSPISLSPLAKEEGLELIKQQAIDKEVNLTDKESREIYHLSGGIPLAMVYGVGQKTISQEINLSPIKPISFLLDNFSNNKTYSLFQKYQKLFEGDFENQILIAISFFPDAPTIEAISEIVGLALNSVELNQGLETLKKLSLIKQKNTQYLMHSVTHEYITKEILQYYDFEKDARVRWVQWYLKLAQKYGGKDWDNWKNKYDKLNAEWNNFLAVLEWCAGQGYYESVRDLWKNINQFANLYNYWNDRIFWLSWLIEESNKREDWKTSAYGMSEKGFTLVQMGDLTHAKSLLQQALSLAKTFDLSNSGNSESQTLICQHFALLYINQKKYKLARHWLQQEIICAKKTINIQQRELKRRMIAIDTLEAEILFKQEKYQEAKELYEKIVKESAQIGWQRRKNQAQEKIAFIVSKLPSRKSRQTHRRVINSNNIYPRQQELDKSQYSQNLAG